MPRHFNTSGPCLADKHYMLPPLQRLGEVRDLIDSEKFFVIHAPRQTGKTTLLRNLSRELTAKGTHAALTISLESLTRPDVAIMIPQLLRSIEEAASRNLPKGLLPPNRDGFVGDPDVGFRLFLSAWAEKIDRPLVLFIDEIDSIPGPLLIAILRQLREGYTARPDPFATSVALVGLKDVRDYKILSRLRQEEKSLGTASPFNVKDRSLTLRDFTEDEVRSLLEQHTEETGQRFADDAAAEIFHQTQGQPWLVNALAAQLTTDFDALVKERSVTITLEHVKKARELLIERRDTHLDSLVDKLRDERIKRVIEPILTGEIVTADSYNDDLRYAEDLGLVSRRGGATRIANPIYQEIIPRVLTYTTQGNVPDETSWYLRDDGTLDMEKLIGGFLKFWQRHGEVLLRGMPYHEAAPHLVFMAYLQRITNGGGTIHREFAIGTGRADLVVDFGGREDVIELKLQRGRWTVPEGLEQVARYASKLGRDVGYLVVFDTKSGIPFEDRGEVEHLEQDGVTVVLVRA